MPDLFWAQAVGMLSFVLGLVCFFQKDDTRLKLVMLAATLNNALHFLLMDAPTAVVAALFSALRTGVSMHTSSRRVAYAFIVLVIAFGAYAAKTWLDCLPILGACFGTYALFCLTGIAMRMLLLCGTLCWLANNMIIGSIGGTLLEFSLLLVNINTIRKLKQSKPSHLTGLIE